MLISGEKKTWQREVNVDVLSNTQGSTRLARIKQLFVKAIGLSLSG